MRMTAENSKTKRLKITEQWQWHRRVAYIWNLLRRLFFEYWNEKCKIDSDYELKPDSAYLLLPDSHHHRYRQWNNQ